MGILGSLSHWHSLDHFDYDGSYRVSYPSGHPIDSSVTLASGEAVTDEASLSKVLSVKPEFRNCLARQLPLEPFGRAFADSDEPYFTELGERIAQGENSSDLYERIVLSTPFRYRRPTSH